MGTITGFTADRMLDIEADSIVSARIVGSDLIVTTRGGEDINAGEVKGADGLDGQNPISRALSNTSLPIGLGTTTFLLSPGMNVPFIVDTIVRAVSAANRNNYMAGYVTAADNGSVTIDVQETGGSGTFADWILGLGAFKGPPGSITVSPAGGVLTGNYPDPGLADASVDTQHIQDGAITREKLALGSGAGGPDLITSFVANGPMIVAHRGAHNLYPENSLEGLRATGQAGFAPETDLRFLASGQAVALHDSTVDRTMTGTGAVASMDLNDWRAIAVKPQIQNGQQAMGALWDDIVNEMGGRFLLVPEVKLAGTQAALIAPVIDRGLQRAVIFQSFDLATAQSIAAAGCAALYLNGATLSGITPEVLFASGVEFVGFSSGVTAADVLACQTAGLKVLIYTIDTDADYNTSIVTKGADGVFTDDPWFVSDRFPVKSSDPFQARDAWPHLVGYTNVEGVIASGTLATTRIQYAPPTGLRRYNWDTTDPATLTISLGWAGQKRGPRLKVRFTVTFLENATDATRWVGLFVGTQANRDAIFHDEATAGQNGYHFLCRRNGQVQIYRVAPATAPSNIASSATPGTPVAVTGSRSQPNRYEITVGAANVTITNLTTGTTVTEPNTAFRGLSRLDLTINGTDAEWSNIGVEELP